MSTILDPYQMLRALRKVQASLSPPASTSLRVPRGAVCATLVVLASLCAYRDDGRAEQRVSLTESPSTAEQAVLLRNGAVIVGSLLDDGDNVRIAVRYGEILVPRREILEVAGTTLELYLRQRDRLPPGEADAHLELAVWCMEHGLTEQARQELQIVRSLRPDHPMIGLAERRIELSRATVADLPRQSQRPESSPPQGIDPFSASVNNSLPLPSWLAQASGVDSPKMPSPTPSRGEIGDDRPSLSIRITDAPSATAPPVRRSDPSVLLRGLPANAGPDFVRVIQPILSNQCATAGCHGVNSPEDRRLIRIPFGRPATRSETAHNLEVVFRWINFEDPGASPLLAVPTRPHGGTSAPIFSGTSARQYRELVDWVFAVTRKDGDEKQPTGPSDAQADMPGGIPPELLQAVSPAVAMESSAGTSDGVVTASAISEPGLVQSAIAWEAQGRAVQLPLADENGRFFPESFSKSAESEHSITLESGKLIPVPSSNQDSFAPNNGGMPARLQPGHAIEQAGLASPNSPKPARIEAFPPSAANPSEYRPTSRSAPTESATPAATEQAKPQVLPFGDHLPAQSNVIYR
ncbi:hypothetical protein [Thermopirellula anaerolimosa]